MEVIRYETISAFYDEVKTFLLEQEDRAQIMLGHCLRNKDRVWEKEQPFLATVKKEGKIKLAAMLIPPHAISLLEKEESDGVEAAPYLVDYLIKENYAVQKVYAPKAVGKAFSEHWTAAHQLEEKVLMDVRLYTLQTVVQPAVRPGKLRLATEEDLSFLPQWIVEMTSEINQLMTRKEAEEYADARVKDGFLFVWEVEGKAVCMASKTRPNVKGIAVNMVYTPKELRGNGYASACVAALSEHLLQEGYEFCSLFTDLANQTANKIYQDIGYQPVCDFVEYKFYEKRTETPS
ncbi:GNAT family N-acetyltransferase [Fictibacillus phosphorivorans]|uniref:GNAT family N-acetyltransferase n=1 Tax=Fictibacillus phosphorivorans TaxID=1221500 RepID=UPI00203F9E12|nr:GNAT family N-acetyltransferase [Fictibacillus phosphorivorans]MCM3720080.1 GNAT family N-acetyltransferase [Fictibacillus phosphorivorans]MCM3777770.1 GNAT family N-acetyltransferase [Fictibacillus phosphorivorans]